MACKVTPQKLADRFGIDVGKVHSWIKSGELRAINAATRTNGRPRFLIDEEDVAAFEQGRQVVPRGPAPARRRSRQQGETIQFFGKSGQVLRRF